MIRRALAFAFLAAVSGALLLAGALPADAGFTVVERGSTITVTQTDTETLTLTRYAAGNLVIGDGTSLVGYPPPKSLVVRGSSALTTSFVNIVLNEPLAGSLTLDLPGASDVTIAGAAAAIGGSLKVKGSDAANQTIRLGATGQSVTIDGSVKFDLRDVEDWVEFRGPATILGSLNAKGVNHLWATYLEVGGSFTMDVKREILGVDFRAQQLFVGKSFTVSSGPGSDYVGVLNSGEVRGNATFRMGDGGSSIRAPFVIGGKATVRMGAGALNEFYPYTVKGSVDVASFGVYNYFELRAPVQGKTIKYAGGAGYDSLLMYTDAPRATAVIALGDGNDSIDLDGRYLKLARLRLDLGGGTDSLNFRGGYVLPPGSTIKGQP